MDHPPPPGLRPLVAVVALLLAAQALLFAAYVRREIAWTYPTQFDQTTGLYLAYSTHEHAQARGYLPAIAHTLRRSPPNTTLLHVEAALLFAVAGPSRLAALFVNWLHFALLQVALVAALWASTRRLELPLLGLGLLLSMDLPFAWAGGLADFRPDMPAFCLYGAFLAAVWHSRVFRRPGWALLAGAVGTLCVLTRTLTAVYLGGLLGLTLAVLAFRGWRESETARRTDLRAQVKGAFLCSASLGLTVLPALAVQAKSLWAYYVKGHLTGKESAVWATLMREDLIPTLLFYPFSALGHGGSLFRALALGSLAAAALARWGPGADQGPVSHGAPRGVGWFLAGALLLPYAVLTADPAKSPVVGGLLLAPLLWLLLTACTRLTGTASSGALRVASAVALLAGAGWQAARLTGPAPHIIPVEAIREVGRLHDDILRCVETEKWPSTVLLADRQRDYLPAIVASAYERHGRLIHLERAMARTVWSPSPEEVMEHLRRSQLVILTRPVPGSPSRYFPFPYDAAMLEMHPRLLAYCERTLTRVGTYRVPEEVALFARAAATREATTRKQLDAPP